MMRGLWWEEDKDEDQFWRLEHWLLDESNASSCFLLHRIGCYTSKDWLKVLLLSWLESLLCDYRWTLALKWVCSRLFLLILFFLGRGLCLFLSFFLLMLLLLQKRDELLSILTGLFCIFTFALLDLFGRRLFLPELQLQVFLLM